MKSIVSAKEAVSLIKNGSTVMLGGFLSCGAPDELIDALVEQNTKEKIFLLLEEIFGKSPLSQIKLK